MGFLITAGHLKQNNANYEVLWNPVYERSSFRATMGISRFKKLLKICRFDDKETRNDWKETEKLAPVRDV